MEENATLKMPCNSGGKISGDNNPHKFSVNQETENICNTPPCGFRSAAGEDAHCSSDEDNSDWADCSTGEECFSEKTGIVNELPESLKSTHVSSVCASIPSKEDKCQLIVENVGQHSCKADEVTECTEASDHDSEWEDCSDEEEFVSEKTNSEIEEGKVSQNIETNFELIDITPEKDGAITKQLIREGDGDETAGFGDTVNINFKGYMIVNGSLQPLPSDTSTSQFVVGKGAMIRGLDIAVSTMKKKEVAVYVIHPKYAYGGLGIPQVIPPSTFVCFEIEMLNWKHEDLSPQKDQGILRKVQERGEASRLPKDGAVVTVELAGYCQGEMFEKRKVEFVLGEGCSAGIVEGVELALYRFRLHEKSWLYLEPDYAFGSSGNKELGIPVHTKVEYEVKLLAFEKTKEIWEMNSDEKYEKAEEARVKGVKYFKEGKFKVALRQFKKIITYLKNEPGVPPESEKPRQQLLIIGYCNAALCWKKQEMYIDAIKLYDQALHEDPENEKALYHRGECRMKINDCIEAMQDFERLFLLNPQNKACEKLMVICRSKIKEQRKKDKSLYQNMFQKFFERDEEEMKRCLQMKTHSWDYKKKQTESEPVTLLSGIN